MHDREIHKVIRILKNIVRDFADPAVTQVSNKTRDPFHVLISCLLSLRTKDPTTLEASKRLFELASAPENMKTLSVKTIENAIYPVGFYRVKAKNIRAICSELCNKYKSKVPATIDELLKLKGVGRKTANLVVTLGYGKPGICVDTHVHRIMNRWGYVRTKTPEDTEFALRKKLPKKYWLIINDLLVAFGQNICKPVSPICSKCRLFCCCCKRGVLKSR